MGRSEFDTAISNWQQRVSYYKSLGIQPSQYAQIARQDLTNTLTTGSSPMATTDVNAAMASQLAGRSLINQPVQQQHHHRGIFGDILHTVTSVPGDVGNLVTGFPAGAVKFAEHLPSELTNTMQLLEHAGDANWMTAHGYEPTTQGSLLHQAAASFRDIAKSPILSLIPGVWDVGQLTTPGGRAYLGSHPVTAALDVAPVGKYLEVGTRGALALTGQAERVGEAGSTLEALQRGQGLRAGFRAVTAGTAIGASVRALVQNVADRIGFSQDMQRLLSAYDVGSRQAARRLIEFARPLFDEIRAGKVDEQRMVEITNEATGISPKTHANAHLVSVVQKLDNELRNTREAMFHATGGKKGSIVVPYGKSRLELRAGESATAAYQTLERITSEDMPQADIARDAAHQNLGETLQASNDLRQQIDKERAQSPDGELSPRTKALQQEMIARLTDAQDRVQRAEAGVATAAMAHSKAVDAFNDALHSAKAGELGGTAEMGPLQRHMMRQRVEAMAEDRWIKAINDPDHPLYDPRPIDHRLKNGYKQLQADLTLARESSDINVLKSLFIDEAERSSPEALAKATEQFEQMRMDVVKSVLGLIRRGLDPVWLKVVHPDTEGAVLSRHLPILPDRIAGDEAFRRVVNDFSPGTTNIAIGLLSAARDQYRFEGTVQFLDKFVLAKAKTRSFLDAEYLKTVSEGRYQARRRPSHGLAAQAADELSKGWTQIRPDDYGLKEWPGGRYHAEDIYIPKTMAHHLKGLMPSDRHGLARLPMYGAYDRGLKVFRFSVLTGPRHLVHVGLGGLFALMMRDPTAPLQFYRAYRIVRDMKDGKHSSWLDEASKNLFGGVTDAVAAKSVGMSYGNMLSKFWQKTGANVERKLANVEETVSDIYRVSAALSAKRRGMTELEALNVANKIAVNMDGMTPFERTVIKQVIPFYGFMKFMFKFMLTYPVDHPYRAVILSRFATQEQEEWNTLIPEKFMMTLFLGHPDSHGNIKSIDMRNLNPFRSFSNDFTLQGFFQSLNPIAGAIATARGFNVLDATGPLYPSLEFNPTTGSLQAAPPSGANQWFTAAEQFLPELGTIDHFVGITDQMRRLKASGNTAAYQSTLYSQLNLPGILAPPVTVNLPYVEERSEMDRYKVASQAVSDFTSGRASADSLRSFAYVPYQGQYYTPDQFIRYWNGLLAQVPVGVDPRAILPTPPIRKTSQNPLELFNAQVAQSGIAAPAS